MLVGSIPNRAVGRTWSRYGGTRTLAPRLFAQSRELRALGRTQNRTAALSKAQLAVLDALACGDDRRVAVTEERVAHCMQRLVNAALVLDRVLVGRAAGLLVD